MRNKDAIFDLAVEYGCEPQSSDEGQYWFEQHYRADEFLEELKKRYPGKDAWVTECLPDDPEWDEPVGGWYVMVRDDSDDEDGEADAQKIKAAEDAVRKIQGTPLMDTEDGSLYICTERGRDGTLYLGCGYSLGNAGLLSATYKIEYDLDRSLDRNLEDLVDELDSQGVRPYGEEEELEDR